MSRQSALFRFLCTGALTAFALSIPAEALCQTWSPPRSRPSIWHLIAVDPTGEAAWTFGFEDVAGDGRTFVAAEQAADIRSAYAAADEARLWLRAYVSSVDAPDSSVRLYVFVDSDGNRQTGGSAEATAIEPAFTSDPSGGGYEHVIGLSGMGAVLGFWDYREQAGTFEANNAGMARVQAEAGTDVDPLRLGAAVHGFVGGSVELSAVPFASTCDAADLFFRSVSDAGDDVDVGLRADCVGGDRNGNRVPDRVEDVPRCSDDDGCPAGGRCISGACRYAPACEESADCGAGESCDDERCVIDGGDSCTSSATCDGLICLNQTCAPCTSEGASCGAGRACAPDGRCVSGTTGSAPDSTGLVDGDERVQGGAFTCGVGRASSGAGVFGLALGFFLLRRRWKASKQS